MSKIVIVDPGCQGQDGHHFMSLKALEAALAPAAPNFVIHADAPDSLDLPARRTRRKFRHSIYTPMARRAALAHSPPDGAALGDAIGIGGDIFLVDFIDLFLDLAVSHQDDLVFPTATLDVVHSMLTFAEMDANRRFPRLHFVFHWVGRHPLLDETLRRLAAADPVRVPAKVYATTDELTSLLRERYGFGETCRFALQFPWFRQLQPTAVARTPGRLAIGCLGGPRKEKGVARYGDIFAAVLELNGRLAAPLDVRFLVQADAGGTLAADLRSRLGPQAGTLVFVDRYLTADAFGAVLSQCTALLLPYDRDRYGRRASGMLIDGMSVGIPSVCTAGTAMCEFIRWGNGLTATTDREFAEALVEIGAHPERFRDGIARASRAVVDGWRSNPLVDGLRQRPRGSVRRLLDNLRLR